MNMRWNIRYQLFFPLLALLLSVVAGISVWSALSSARQTRKEIETRMRHVAQVINEGPFPLHRDVLKMTKGLSGAEYLLLRGGDELTTTLTGDDHSSAIAKVVRIHEGSLEVRLARGTLRLPAPRTLPEDPMSLQLGPEASIEGQTFLCSGVRVRQKRPQEAGSLYILYPESLWRDALREAILPSVALGALGALASMAVAFGLAQRFSRRIQELERRTRLIAAGDFSPMPLPRRNDELRDLGQSVNEMAQKLADLQDAVKKSERLRVLSQVGSGLAHQLRNGVTGARLAIQLHASECNGKADPEALDVALRQLALVEANLKKFLDLGRTEELCKQSCSLTALIDETVKLLLPQCRHAHTELRWTKKEEIRIEADGDQLRHLFLNVIGNAVEAAGPGGWVEVRSQESEVSRQVKPRREVFGAERWSQRSEVRSQRSEVRSQESGLRTQDSEVLKKEEMKENTGSAIIEVIDSGAGPSLEVASRLFEPFVTGKREGVGLGLAVARRVAEAHGGTIDWYHQDGQTCFRIELPLVAKE